MLQPHSPTRRKGLARLMSKPPHDQRHHPSLDATKARRLSMDSGRPMIVNTRTAGVAIRMAEC